MCSLLARAKKFHDQGINTIPLGKEKRPICKYRQWYSRRMTDDEFSGLWRTHKDSALGIGLLGGAHSNGFCCIDIDDPDLIEPFEKNCKENCPELFKRLLVTRTGSNKRHYDFFLNEPGVKRTTLAHQSDGSIGIELLAGRRMTVAAGSTAACHPAGKPYRRVAGPRTDCIQTLSVEDAEILCKIARSFDKRAAKYSAVEEFGPKPVHTDISEIDLSRPGDDFCSNGTWNEILAPSDPPDDWAGDWMLTQGDSESQYWRHPNSRSKAKWSLRTGLTSEQGRELAFLFSDSIDGLDAERTYNKFQLLAHLHYGGDFEKCATDLSILGYGAQPEAVDVLNVDGGSSIDWPVLRNAALHGPVGEFVRLIEPHTEADNAALLFQFLAVVGNIAGRDCHFRVEGDRHFPKLFLGLVGESAKSRKGTSLSRVNQVVELIEPDYLNDNRTSGIGSGQALIHNVRDEVKKLSKDGDWVVEDAGVSDKRLIVEEGELASILNVINTDTSTLSAVIRDAWDDRKLRNNVKGSPATATGSHVSISGHITQAEFRRKLKDVEIANGFGNRFLWCCVRRSKLLPEGGDPPAGKLQSLASQIRKRLNQLKEGARILRSSAASELWRVMYAELADVSHSPIVDSLTARAEAQITRLSLIYALLDGANEIDIPHLRAAKAAWQYCEDSVRYLYTGAEAEDKNFTLRSLAEWIRVKHKGQVKPRHVQAGRRGVDTAKQARRLLRELGQAGFGAYHKDDDLFSLN